MTFGKGKNHETTYEIREIGDELMWKILTQTGELSRDSWRLVDGPDAEALTDLHMPAAMDRLRELVHESS